MFKVRPPTVWRLDSLNQIRVTKFDSIISNQMRGLLDVEVDVVICEEQFTLKISSCKLMESKADGSLWIGLPSSQRFASGQPIYNNLINFGDRSQQDAFGAMVLAALEEFRGRAA